MLRDIFGKTLWEQRRTLVWWSIGILVFVGILVAFFPSIKGSSADFDRFVKQLPEGLRTLFIGNESDITSPVGYLDSQIYATAGPVLFLVFTIGAGARAVAGEEERHTLDLLLSTPVSRRTVVLQKFAAMVVAALGLAALFVVGLAAGGPPLGIHVSILNLVAATTHLYLFALSLGTIGLAFGCATGRRSAAIGGASAVAVASLLLSGLAPVAHATAWMDTLSPFHYANGSTPLRNGFDWAHLAVLAAMTAAALVAAVVTFDRRDLTT